MFFLFAFPFHFFFKCLTPRIEAVILHGPSLYVLQIMHHPLSPLSHPNASWYFDVKQRMVKSLSQYQTPILGIGNIVIHRRQLYCFKLDLDTYTLCPD